MYLYGASGHAKVIIENLKSQDIEISGIFDDNLEVKQLLNYPVLGAFNKNVLGVNELIISIGNNHTRNLISKKIDVVFGKAIHRNTTIASSSRVDVGTVIMNGAIIQPDVFIGKHVIVNTCAIIEHDCIIEDFVHVSPNATLCGNTKIGTGSHIGAGSVVIQGITIGKWCIIGAGSVIIRDIPDNSVVVGNPGRIIKKC